MWLKSSAEGYTCEVQHCQWRIIHGGHTPTESSRVELFTTKAVYWSRRRMLWQIGGTGYRSLLGVCQSVSVCVCVCVCTFELLLELEHLHPLQPQRLTDPHQ